MKTTKKGFTLIELIVVIAIIGVLAAILVPTMLGYVRKSKISSANSSAASIYKAVNSALTELDEEGVDIGGDLLLYYTASSNTWAVKDDGTGGLENNTGLFAKKVTNFFADIINMKQGVYAGITGGSCVSVACAADSTYSGSYPGGIINSDNYETYKVTAKGTGEGLLGLMAEASKKAGYTASVTGEGDNATATFTKITASSES